MKMVQVPDEQKRSQSTDELKSKLLVLQMKMKQLATEMRNDMKVQKAEEELMLAKSPFKRAGAKWRSEIEAIELELRTRNVKFNIDLDEIFEFDEQN